MSTFKKTLLASLALLLLFLPIAKSQETHVMSNATTPFIDGKLNPEQIPLKVILRFWLNSVTYDDVIRDFPETSLSDSDRAVVKIILKKYKAARTKLLQNEANGTITFDQLQAGEYKLVNDVVAGASANLSVSAYNTFLDFLENQKAGLSLSPYDAGLGDTAARNLMEARMNASMAMPQSGGTMISNYSTFITQSITSLGSAQDNFNDRYPTGIGVPMGSNWTPIYGTFTVNTNTLTAKAATVGGPGQVTSAIYSSTVNGAFSKNQTARISVSTVPTMGGAVGIGLRMTASTQSYYVGEYNSGSPSFRILKYSGGTASVLASVNTTAIAVSDILTFSVKGSALTLSLNNVTKLTASDSTITTGAPGLAFIRGTHGSYGEIRHFDAQGDVNGLVYVSMSGNTNCGGTCPVATHTPKITWNDSHSNGVFTGGSYAPASNINLQAGINLVAANFDVGGDDPIDTEEEVDCSLIGPIYNFSSVGNFDWELAWTKEKSTTGIEQNCVWLDGPLSIMNCDYPSQYWCTAATSPPDQHLSPTSWQEYPIPSLPPYWITVSLCLRYSHGPWASSRGFSIADYNTFQYFCTHNP